MREVEFTVMAFYDLSGDEKFKTLLTFREDEGFTIERLSLTTGAVGVMPLSERELQAIAEGWAQWRSTLKNVDVPAAKQAMPYQRTSKGSPGHANSHSSSKGRNTLL